MAEACLEAGAIVTVSSSRQSNIDNTIARLQKSYPDHRSSNITGYPCDLGDGSTCESNLKALLDQTTSKGAHKLDHIVHTAGDVFKTQLIEEFDQEVFVKTMQVRLFSSITLAKLAPNYMNVSSRSSITFTTGINNDRPQPGWALTIPGTAAKEGFARGAAIDLKPMRVNTVSPGAVNTELFGKFAGGDQEKLQAILDVWGKKSLSGEVGKPEDVAEAYLYCMRDGFVTGQVIKSEGGYLLT